MLTCLPTGICSWNYRVTGGKGVALVMFEWAAERGAIEHEGSRWEVVKHGWASGKWTLERGKQVMAGGQKVSAFSREFELMVSGKRFRLVPKSMFTRTFVLMDGSGKELGEIAKEHPMTRRAMIVCGEGVEEIVQLFAFWLVVMMWRREQQSN